MKIEIHSPSHPANGYTIYIAGTRQRLSHGCGMMRHEWDEDDISKLLDNREWLKFENGEYSFNVPSWKIAILEGRKVPANNEQLRFSAQFD